MLKRIFLFLLVPIGLGLLYLFFWPVDIEPAAYTPPPNPGLTGIFAVNNKLASAEKVIEGVGVGPEDIAFGPDSLFYTGFYDGRIVRFDMDGKGVEEFAHTGGRPLGMKFDKAGNLIVADEYKGLISIDTLGQITTLTDEVDGTTIFYADYLDIAEDGIIYFSDATQRNRDVIKEVWEMQPTGRLLSYNPSTKETKIELDKLLFANGVAIAPNGEYLLLTETMGLRIHKYWLKGPKKGQTEIWTDKLPCFPDNIHYNGKGSYWLACPDLRVAAVEQIMDKPFLRKMVYRLPTSLTGAEPAPPHGIVMEFDENGTPLRSLQDTTGVFYGITSANEFDGILYVGSLRSQVIGKYKLN